MMRTITVLANVSVLCLLALLVAATRPKPAAESPQEKAAEAAQQAHDQAVADAQTALNNAQADLDAVYLKAQKEFQASPDYVAANTELTTDQTAYDAAAGTVKAKVDATPEFADAKAKSDKSQAELADLKANSGSSDDEVFAKAQEALNSSSAAHKLESDAIAADPTASAAQQTLVAAQKKIDALNADFHQKELQAPDYIAAKKAVDDANKKLIALEHSKAAAPATAGKSIRGKITAIVSNSSFKIAVPGSKTKTMLVKYTNSVTLTGVASGLIDKTTVGETATIVGTESGNTITATKITITGTPKAAAQ